MGESRLKSQLLQAVYTKYLSMRVYSKTEEKVANEFEISLLEYNDSQTKHNVLLTIGSGVPNSEVRASFK